LTISLGALQHAQFPPVGVELGKQVVLRKVNRLCVASVSSLLVLVACGERDPGEKVIRSAQAIQGGTEDMDDPAVVSMLINTSQGMALCSGSLIGPNLVLTAHHCVATPPNNLVCGATFSATYAASSFVVTPSYDAAGLIFNSANPTFPTPDGVTWFGVQTVAVPGSNICGDDMATLTLTAPMTGICPLIPAVDVQPADNASYTAIGFGITSPNGTTAGTRYRVSGMTVLCFGSSDCQDSTISATLEWEGGSTAQKGTCEGDSGGPALDSSGRIIGTVSRGPGGACNQTVYESTSGQAAWIQQMAQQAATAGGYTAAGWVTGGATSDPGNGYCAGLADGGAPADGGGGDGSATGADAAADAEVDANAPLDASAPMDASAPIDAGTVAEAGGGQDAAGPPGPDAGRPPVVDASAGAMDAGHTASDAAPGEAAPASSDSGCLCSTPRSSGDGVSWPAGLGVGALAMTASLRRRRRHVLRER
jgi:hypothetical protein